MRHAESDMAKALVNRWRVQYPKLAGALIHIPNGAHLAGSKIQRMQQMKRMKEEGLIPGASDYFLAVPRGKYGGMFLEIKAEKGRPPTTLQLDFLEQRRAAGYCGVWAKGLDAAWAEIQGYMDIQ